MLLKVDDFPIPNSQNLPFEYDFRTLATCFVWPFTGQFVLFETIHL